MEYYLSKMAGPYRRVTRAEWVAAERAAGFHNTQGRPGEPATSSFAGVAVRGSAVRSDETPESYSWNPPLAKAIEIARKVGSGGRYFLQQGTQPWREVDAESWLEADPGIERPAFSSWFARLDGGGGVPCQGVLLRTPEDLDRIAERRPELADLIRELANVNYRLTTVGDLIAELSTRPRHLPVRLVVTYRSMDHGDPVDGREFSDGGPLSVLEGTYSGEPVVEVHAGL